MPAPTSDANPRASLTRRNMLRGGGATLLFTPWGCDFLGTEPGDASEGDGAQQRNAQGREAPMLADLVGDGSLPPVEERLPLEPLVIEPVDRVGVYGGDWPTAVISTDPGGWMNRLARYDNLLRWNDELRPEPNLAVSWEISGDGREYTFVLREGVRWSDGEPFTTRDIAFAFEEVWSHTDLYPSMPEWLLSAGQQPPTLEVVDQTTFRLVYPEPKSLLLEQLANPNSHLLVGAPRHYLEQFHADHASDATAMAADAGFTSWTENMLTKVEYQQNPELPTLCAWRMVQPLGPDGRVIVERNPFYWKTDPDGAQLPYIDRIVATAVSDVEAARLGSMNGEYSMPFYETTALQNKPVLAEHRESGSYRFVDIGEDNANEVMISFNLTHENPALREVFNTHDFRVGLSYAINRQDIIDVVFQQQGEPWQVAPLPDSYAYQEELATQYTQHDPGLANEHLDRAFPDKDDDGFRTGPDGRRIRFTVEVPVEQPDWVDTLELVVDSWRDVGIHAEVQNEATSLFTERTTANSHDASANHAEGGLDPIFDPRCYIPVTTGSTYAIQWMNWYQSDGSSGEEPPDSVRRQLELYEEVLRTVDDERQRELFSEVLAISQEQFFTIGITPILAGYTVVQDFLHNVPDEMTLAWVYPGIFPYRAEQYFVSEEN